MLRRRVRGFRTFTQGTEGLGLIGFLRCQDGEFPEEVRDPAEIKWDSHVSLKRSNPAPY